MAEKFGAKVFVAENCGIRAPIPKVTTPSLTRQSLPIQSSALEHIHVARGIGGHTHRSHDEPIQTKLVNMRDQYRELSAKLYGEDGFGKEGKQEQNTTIQYGVTRSW